MSAFELAQAGAGFVEVVVLLGEAEAEQVFAAAGAEEGGAGDRGDAGCGEQIAGFFRGGFAGEARRVGQNVVGAGGDGGRQAGVAQRGRGCASRLDWWSAATCV